MSVTEAVATGRLEVRVSPLAAPDLVRDYLAGSGTAAQYFASHPHDPAAYRRKTQEVADRLPRERRHAVAQAIRATSAGAAARLERILDGDGVFVTTGQQAVLFGGPLYTVHKALAAVCLARTLESVLERPVAPLFWVAADDHDWAEVNHTFVLTPQNELRRIELEDDQGAPADPMSVRALGPTVELALREMKALLPDTEFAGPLRDLLDRAYQPGRSMASAFEDLLASLFADFGLLIVNPADPAVKAHAAPILAKELEQAASHTEMLLRQAQSLVSSGYHAQVTISPDAANVLMHDDHGRDRLVREDGAWILRRSRRTLTHEELLARLEADPVAFSPNVLLRPVVESALLPTIAYVGGPAEVSYFAQIGCLFAAHGVEPPVVFPRFTVTLVESKVRKVLDKFGMQVDAFGRPFHEVAAQLARDEMPAEVRSSLETLRIALRSGYDRLSASAGQIDPTLVGWLEGLRNNALGQTDSAEKKITWHLKKKSEVEIEQLRKAAINLFPEGSPQERVLNPFPYLARYGPELLQQVMNALPLELGSSAPGWTSARGDG